MNTIKNSPAAAGVKRPRKKQLPTWGSFRDGSRWRAFLHSRLWIGLLPAAAFGFGVVFLLATAVGFEPSGKALLYGFLAGALSGFGWMIGIWALLGPDEQEETEVQNTSPTLFGRFAAWLWVVFLLFLLLASSDVVALIDGTGSWSKAAVTIVSKSLMLLAMGISIGTGLRNP